MTDDPFIGLMLAPILIPQGMYTRKITPKLPEAAGARSGAEGSGSPINLLILGDSAAAGVGVDRQQQALSGQLVNKLSGHYSVNWRLEAETGLKTDEVIKKLQDMSAFETDIVVVSLGVNDVTSSIGLAKWLRLQKQLRELLVSKFKAKHILLSSIPPMHRFPALPQPLRWYLGRRASTFNSALLRESLGLTELEFIKVEFPITSGFIAEDGFHPSQQAYTFWSDITARHILHRWANKSQN